RQILNVLKKWRNHIILGTLFCGFAAGLMSYFILPPVYQAQTLLMINQAADKVQANPTTETNGDNLDNLDNVSRLPVLTMNTYLGQLKSEDLMKRIIKKLHLKYSVGSLAEMINAQVLQDSNLIQIKVNNTDPKLASKIANTLSDEYLKIMTEKNKEQMSRSVAFLEEQKKLNDKKLNEAEGKLHQFMSQTSGNAALQTKSSQTQADAVIANSNLRNTGAEIHQLNSDINTINQQLTSTPQFIDAEQLDPSTGSIIKTQQPNPAYAALSQQLAEKKAVLTEKQRQYTVLNNRVKQLDAQVKQLNTELNVQSDPASKQLEQNSLQSEVDRLRKTSETLAQKVTEAQISKSIDLGNSSAQVVSKASIPTVPVKPNKILNICIALILGLAAFTLLAFILEYLDNTLKTSEDITRELQLPVLAMIPTITKEDSHHYY
ncbi:MAG TPA: GNVR domain-containing protein, partial [Syntrophomonadaceae bacterium]|nr:GNVR domain-containing protein [Syntrophomonadaceae bacterium]